MGSHTHFSPLATAIGSSDSGKWTVETGSKSWNYVEKAVCQKPMSKS